MKRILILFFLGVILFVFPIIVLGQGEPQFQPLPYQDAVNGRNLYAYNAAIGKPANDSERKAFLDRIKPLAISAQETTKVPACAIGGMAILESGYGFTRTAYFANNLFGMKVWNGQDTPNNWQLKGQPDETDERSVKIIKNHGLSQDNKPRKECLVYDKKRKEDVNENCVVFEEKDRKDNRYRKFADYEAVINYFAGEQVQKQRYKRALETYLQNRQAGMAVADACKTYIYDLVETKVINGITYGGYSHIGGKAYLEKVIPILDKWNLYSWSQK